MTNLLSSNANSILNARYLYKEIGEKTWEQLSQRVGTGLASIETEKERYAKEFSEIIYDLYFLPAGRILRNVGRPRGSLLNCHLVPVNDNIEDIFIKWIAHSAILWSEGSGVGCTISSLRPNNAPILGKGGVSSGPLSFLEIANMAASKIKTGGDRRAAGLAMLAVTHPDINEFIDIKLEDDKIKNFNLSVGVNEKFLTAVESSSEWTLKFLQKEYNTVPAKDLWNKIIKNMLKNGEPGLLNLSNMMTNNSYYYSPITGVNPCGEANLEPYGSCCLGSLVLPNFITGSINTNWKKLEQVIRTAVRMLDNVLSVNKYILSEIEQTATNGRRIGLGIMGLAEYLFAKKLRYGSEKAILEIERLMKFIRNITYSELVNLSVEKGSFPKFDSVLYSKAKFIRTLPTEIRKDIKNKGSRCVTALAVAPTGTLSLIADVQASAEPLPYKAYKRSDRVSDRIYIHDLYKKAISENNGETPEWFVDSTDLKVEDHFEVQTIIQKYIDSSVSKTILLPNDINSEDFSELLLLYIRNLKGVTVYRDGSRKGQPLNKISKKEAEEYIKNNLTDSNMDIETVSCAKGNCEL